VALVVIVHPEPKNGHNQSLETSAMLKEHATFCKSRQLSYRVQFARHIRRIDVARSPCLSHTTADKVFLFPHNGVGFNPDARHMCEEL